MFYSFKRLAVTLLLIVPTLSAVVSVVLFERPGGTIPAPTLAADERVLGDPKAPLLVVEYASLTCPHCAAFYIETLPRIQDAYISTGKIAYAAREFPLSLAALDAAAIARCLPKNLYFGYVGALYLEQDAWRESSDSAAYATEVAIRLGIEPGSIEACSKDEGRRSDILIGMTEAMQRYGIQGMPTVMVGAKVLVAPDYATLAKAIDEALANGWPFDR